MGKGGDVSEGCDKAGSLSEIVSITKSKKTCQDWLFEPDVCFIWPP